jgi:hypothetical protein
MKDKYDIAMEILLAIEDNRDFKRVAYHAWSNISTDPLACLFSMVTPSGRSHAEKQCGCLTQVKGGDAPAWTDELTQHIRQDPRIPEHPNEITKENLVAFAEWQRFLDRTIRNQGVQQ